jgi:Ni,Fe-hydrogenase I cytochrome b subunit
MWRVVKSLKETAYFPLAIAIMYYSFLLLFPMTWGGLDLYENFVMNAYFWLLLGVFFRLPLLARGSGTGDPTRDPLFGRASS